MEQLRVCAGLPVQTGLHRDAGAAGGDDRRFLANALGAQLDHRSHVDQTARTGSGQYSAVHLWTIFTRLDPLSLPVTLMI